MPLNPTMTAACPIRKPPSPRLPRPRPRLVAKLYLDGRATLRSRSMHAHQRRTTKSLGLIAVVFLVIGTVSTIGRIPVVDALHAQTDEG